MTEQMIPIISLWQPWATALVMPHATIPNRGVKEYETRSWATNIRGNFLIHAAKKPVSFAFSSVPMVSAAQRADMDYILGKHTGGALPFGAIVGAVNIENIIQSDSFVEDGSIHSKTPVNEWGWGDWGKGRFGWKCANPLLFTISIAHRGQQGIWRVPLSIIPEQYHEYFF